MQSTGAPCYSYRGGKGYIAVNWLTCLRVVAVPYLKLGLAMVVWESSFLFFLK